MRRIATIIVSGGTAIALLGAPAEAAAPASESATTVVAKRAKPAQPAKACRKRLAKPKKVVPSKRFAKCVVKSMLRNRTVHLSSKFSDGSSNKGDGRFKKKYTEASVRYSNGSRLVLLGGKAWLKATGQPWAKAKNGGTPQQQLAWNVQELWVGLSSAKAYRAYLRSSSTGWTPTKRHKRINGVKAREYAGTVRMADATFDKYRVWVDKWDRPIRIASTVTVGGITVSGRQDFKKWGKKVKITKPKVG